MISAAPLRSRVIRLVLLLPSAGAFLTASSQVGKRPALTRSRAGSIPALPAMLLLSAMASMAGCASHARQILTSANSYHYHSARYEEACRSQPRPVSCDKRADTLRRWYVALQEANAALQRGGGLPLQTAALKKVEKEARKWKK